MVCGNGASCLRRPARAVPSTPSQTCKRDQSRYAAGLASGRLVLVLAPTPHQQPPLQPVAKGRVIIFEEAAVVAVVLDPALTADGGGDGGDRFGLAVPEH